MSRLCPFVSRLPIFPQPVRPLCGRNLITASLRVIAKARDCDGDSCVTRDWNMRHCSCNDDTRGLRGGGGGEGEERGKMLGFVRYAQVPVSQWECICVMEIVLN